MHRAPEFECHGLHLQVPASWDEQSIYRYLVPTGADASLHANIIVTKHKRSPDQPLEQALARPPRDACESGVGRMAGRLAAWLDLAFDSELAGVRLFQRQIALVADQATLVVFTLTSVDSSLDEIAGGLGFAKA